MSIFARLAWKYGGAEWIPAVKFRINLSNKLTVGAPSAGTALALWSSDRYISFEFPDKASGSVLFARAGGLWPGQQGFRGLRVQ